MAKGDIVSEEPERLETSEEAALRVWFDEQEKLTIANLEAGARQIIQLVTAFYGLVLGLVSLGREEVAASLATPLAVALSGIALLSLLVAIGMALVTVAPRRYEYRNRSLSDEKKIYQQIVANKAGSLRIALVTFGLGLGAFAWLIFDILYRRLG